MAEQFLAIVNPAAGGGRCGKEANDALASLREAGLDIAVFKTGAPGEATQVARKAFSEGVRRFIAVGGDGTGFEIVNGLFPEAFRAKQVPTLGFLPLGTGNSFLRDFTTEGAIYSRKALMERKRRRCDVIWLKHRDGDLFYINILSFGFVADACTVANQRFKRFGEAGYGLGVVTKLIGLEARPIPVALDGGSFDERPKTFISINNSRFTGGKMMMAPNADASDGLAELISVGALSRFGLLSTFPKIFEGTHVTHPAVESRQARSIVFKVDRPMDAMIDGEVISVWPERLEVLHQALEVCV
ncbi:MAG: diacylglycerol kinase family lipid kinase [Myxococcales bacterium]